MFLVGNSNQIQELLSSNENPVGLTLIDEGGEVWHDVLISVGRMLIYALVMAIVMGLLVLLLKLVDNSCEGGGDENQRLTAASSETSRLLAKDPGVTYMTYGTCDGENDVAGEDVEAGKCSSSKVWSEDLYDGKICVICYDKHRNCFFIPCGHCATCYVCARRIKDEESKTCPVCRRYIRKVKKLLV